MITRERRYTWSAKGSVRLAVLLLVCIFTVSGCFAGQGDWKYALTNGYAIVRINAHGIALVHYKDPTGSGESVIPNFFVTDFCMNQAYIGVKGIRTEDIWATDKEIQNGKRMLYLVDVSKGDVHGPYSDMESFKNRCDKLSCGNMSSWKSVDEIAAGAKGNAD